MRWLVTQPGPSWSVHDVFVGWCEALRELGQDVYTYELGDRLSFFGGALLPAPAHPAPEGSIAVKQAFTAEQGYELAADGITSPLWKIKPDVLLVISGYFLDHQMLDHARRNHGVTVIVLHTEQPYELERELELAAHADLNLLNDPTHIEKFRAVAPTVYAPHAYRPSVHHPGPARDNLRSDLAFVGTGFGSRRWFFEQLRASGATDGLDVILAGNWQGLAEDSPLAPWIAAESPSNSLDNAEAAEVYRATRCSMNLYRREADEGSDFLGWSMGPREIELAACGTFFLRDPRPEGDSLLPMLPTFAGPDEAAELIRWWLNPAHDGQRLDAARLAREAIEDRTFTNSARHLLGMLDRRPVTQ